MYKVLVTLNGAVVTGIRQVGHGAIEDANDMVIPEYDASLLGKTWDGANFIATPISEDGL